MSTEEPSSKDATVIDDDLVAALGFEPTVRSTDPGNAVLVAADDYEDSYEDFPHRGTNGSSAVTTDDEAETGVDGETVEAVDELTMHDTDSILESDDDVAEIDDLVIIDTDSDAVVDADESAMHVTDALIESEPGQRDSSDGVLVEESDLEDAADTEIDTGIDTEAELLDADLAEDELESDGDDDAGLPTALIDLTGDDVEVDDAGSEPTDSFAAATFAGADAPESSTSVFEERSDSASLFDDGEFDDRDLDHVELDGVELDGVDLSVPTSPPLVAGEAVAIGTTVAAESAPATARERRKTILRAKKSRRVIRHIDPWSVLTFSMLFHLCFFAAMLLASVLVWRAADAAGTISNAESFIMELGDYESYEIKGDVVFRAALLIAGMLTLASSIMVVLLTVVFNLISDLIGGIRVTVLEEETVRVPASASKRNG